MIKDIVRTVFSYIEYDEIKEGRLHLVCKTWRKIIKDPNEPGFLSDMRIDSNTSMNEIMRHLSTLRRIHIKYVDDIDKWVPFQFPSLRFLHLERCTFRNIDSLIPSRDIKNRLIKMERCNEKPEHDYKRLHETRNTVYITC